MKKLKSLLILSLLILAMLVTLTITACDGTTENPEKEEFIVSYLALEGGTIEGETAQTIEKGGDTTEVTAKANNGYLFANWSDGDKEPIRQDTNIQKNTIITATFKKVEEIINLTVTYIAGEGGTIDDEPMQTQNVIYGQSADTVTAIPNPNYDFVKWSDGITTESRTDPNIKAEFTVTAIFAKKQAEFHLQIEYRAGVGGTIDSESIKIQNVVYGHNAEKVTAIANSNYEFLKWSDGVTTEERTDPNIRSEFTVIAIFKKVSTTFTYVYNNATDGYEEETIELRFDEFATITLPTPIKEYFNFAGWYLDLGYNIQVSDNLGNIVIGDELFNDDLTCLYAKWDVVEKTTYKILMIFVTKIEATLMTRDGQAIAVNYELSPLEKQIVSYLPQKFEDTLNEMMEGLVTFEVDSHITAETIGEESFTRSSDSKGWYYTIFGDKIPEVQHLLPQYRSVITSFSMDDYDNILHNSAGGAIRKYAGIHLESMFENLLVNGGKIEEYLDLSYWEWESMMYLYAHEFTHTVEAFYPYDEPLFSYHTTIAYYGRNIPHIYVTKQYLLNKADVGIGELVGVPYSYWKGNSKTFTYVYNGATGGNSEESVELSYENIFGANLAFPIKDGFVFDGWFLDENFLLRVTNNLSKIRVYDEFGISLTALTLFDVTSDNLYAKWIPI